MAMGHAFLFQQNSRRSRQNPDTISNRHAIRLVIVHAILQEDFENVLERCRKTLEGLEQNLWKVFTPLPEKRPMRRQERTQTPFAVAIIAIFNAKRKLLSSFFIFYRGILKNTLIFAYNMISTNQSC